LDPIFCDVEDNYYTICPDLIESLITENTSAIVATHVYGFMCNVEAIDAIAKKHNLKVIYDSAHAFGVRKNGVSAANFGDAAMFSTHATKVFHTIEGGILAYKDVELFNSLPYLVNFGITSQEDIDFVGTNAKMNEFEAAMGICNLRHIDDNIEKRKAAGDRYFERLTEIASIKLLKIPSDLEWNYAYFPILLKDGMGCRDQVKAALGDKSIYARKYFFPSMDRATCYSKRLPNYNLPVSHYASEHVLALPMSSELSLSEVDRICDIIESVVVR
jgi:dTDP-4-amino-4,6-dideoxygalactose transaminase